MAVSDSRVYAVIRNEEESDGDGMFIELDKRCIIGIIEKK
jgi:hypothetical protein